jgi:NAD(P)-dependent dehydrogenase (short-subunit alcohol dehydrogenase family)
LTVAEASELLRPGLLSGVSILVACPSGPGRAGEAKEAADGAGTGAAVAAACEALGATLSACEPDPVEETALDRAVAEVVARAGKIDLLAVDSAGLFAACLARDGDGDAALRACMDASWNATRAVVNGAFLAGDPGPAGGRIVYLAPPPDAGEYADAARAGLENLARTLSVEWARHGITTATIALGAGSHAEEAAALVAYLASPAGAYFSGCLLDLRGP